MTTCKWCKEPINEVPDSSEMSMAQRYVCNRMECMRKESAYVEAVKRSKGKMKPKEGGNR